MDSSASSNLNDLLGLDPAPTWATLPAVSTESEVAQLLGVSSARIRGLARDGVLLKVARGRYDTAASVTRYCAKLRESAERAGRPVDDGVKAATERLKRAQADLAETKALQARGEVVLSAEVTREWASLLRDLRNALLAVPSRCGATLPHLTATDVATMEREIRAALEGLVEDGN